jgi:HAD superfamily hydrolase (TIGR01509 family)
VAAAQDWIAARRAGMEPTPEVLALARAIRDGGQATLVLLTNNNPLLAEELPAIYPEVAQLFAPYAWCSSMFGTSKPDPMVFERVALALGAHPSSLYFIDDSAANIAAAEHAGLRGAFHFTGDVSALRVVLQDVGALPAAATLSADQLTVGLLTGVSYVSGIDYYTQVRAYGCTFQGAACSKIYHLS